MKLSKELSDNIKYSTLEGKEDLRFELFDWLKEKGLSVRQATELLAMTRGEIIEARRREMDDMKLYQGCCCWHCRVDKRSHFYTIHERFYSRIWYSFTFNRHG